MSDVKVVRDEAGKPRLVLTPGGDMTKSFYADQYKEGERTRIEAMTDELGLAPTGEIWMQRVINRRLLERVTGADPADLELDRLVDVVKALAAGTGRVARLLQQNKAMTGGLEGMLKASIERALDELKEEEGWDI